MIKHIMTVFLGATLSCSYSTVKCFGIKINKSVSYEEYEDAFYNIPRWLALTISWISKKYCDEIKPEIK